MLFKWNKQITITYVLSFYLSESLFHILFDLNKGASSMTPTICYTMSAHSTVSVTKKQTVESHKCGHKGYTANM